MFQKLFAIVFIVGFIGVPFTIGQPSPEVDREDFIADLMRAFNHIEEEYVTPTTKAQLLRWSVEALHAEFKQPIPAELAERIAKVDPKKRDEIRQILRDAYAPLLRDKNNTGQKAFITCINAIFLKLEPAATPAERSSAQAQPECLCILFPQINPGIGVKLKSDPDTGFLQVVTPILNGPAYKSGLRGGHIISNIRLTVDGLGNPLNPPKDHSTKGMTPEVAYELLLGKQGTSVILAVIPAK